MPAPRSPSWWRSPAILPAVCLLVTGGIIAAESRGSKGVALAIVIMDGGVAAGVLVAAALAGGWLVRLLGLGSSSWADRFMVGAGLGIGCLSAIILGLGSAGWLSRPVARGLVWSLAVLGLLRVLADLWPVIRSAGGDSACEAGTNPVDRREALALTPFHYLWLLVCPFLAIAALAAANPPGLLWAEEAGGYDVLEYHLAVPREFFEAGRIFFMPYNVYSNFPLNSEMTSLLMMTLRGDAIEAAFPAQMANVVLGALFVAAAWWAGRTYSRPAGIVAGVLAAMTPWIAYLAGIAYAEPGMLAMGMLSLGAMLRAGRAASCGTGVPPVVEACGTAALRCDSLPAESGWATSGATSWAIAAGLLAGLAAGYKYTAIPLILIPIATMPLLMKMPWRWRLRRAFMFILASIITFSPWMIRNVANTRNPVFPLAYKVFGARAGTWDDTLDARWEWAHGSAGSGMRRDESQAMAVLQRTVGDFRMGPVLLALAAVGAISRRDRSTAMLLMIFVVQFAVWLLATHLFARFAVVLVMPMLLLAARLVEASRSKVTFAAFALVLVGGAGLNLYALEGLYYHHTRSGDAPFNAYGGTNLFVKGKVPGCECLQTINEMDRKIHLLLVGEARTFYITRPHEYAVAFNHHPLAEAVRRFSRVVPASQAGRDAAGKSPQTGSAPATMPGGGKQAAWLDAKAVLRWLHQRGTTHVLVNWGELARLQATYGLDAGLTPGLFDCLQDAGLIKIGDWSLEDNGPPYTTLYEVPNE